MEQANPNPNSTTNDDNYKDFDINSKNPLQLKYHNGWISCATVLNDGRFATGSEDKSIIIYNNKTYKPDLTIKEHNGDIISLIQLSSGVLCSASNDKTIKLYNIDGNNYNVLQTLSDHILPITKITELSNQKLAACSVDQSIIFYSKNNNEYTKDFNIKTNGGNDNVVQTKDNEICYYEGQKSTLCFFDLQEKKNVAQLNNISITTYGYDSLAMMSKELLLVAGCDKLTIINTNSYSIVRTIEVKGAGNIYTLCLLTDNIVLTGDYKASIIQWKIEGDNLTLVSKRNKAHTNKSAIKIIKKIGNGLIMSGDGSGEVKVWI